MGDWKENFIYWNTSGGLEIIKQPLAAVPWVVGGRCNGLDLIFGLIEVIWTGYGGLVDINSWETGGRKTCERSPVTRFPNQTWLPLT